MNTSKAEQPELFDALTCDPLELIERGGEALTDTSRWPQRLQELFDIELRYSRRTMEPDAAAADAGARTVLLADYLGGSAIYLPRGDALRKAVRDAMIYARFTRTANVDALAREFGVTTPHLYEIVAREKRRQLAKRQGRLFES
jgi:Mor family transcriptional regulator